MRPLDKKRAKISPNDLDEWFANYEKFIQDVGVVDCPGQIWNCDETGFDLQGRAGKVMGPASTKQPCYLVSMHVGNASLNIAPIPGNAFLTITIF